ncbi:MAG: branched-chain amino acid ABC transporter permease [Clostridia bacterium]|nr:branched-chain amino acid ABC transporter permease [Clostridia bacterium]MBQ3056820.1 branched-chain amino acid ABC transporter permease [Clostridia bacterium]
MNFFTALINGLSAGGTYAIIALGYTMVYGIAKMLNFAHGDIIMVGGYAMYLTLLAAGHPLLALIAAIVCCVVLGVLVERFAYKPLRGASPLAVLITAIGVSFLLQSVAQIAFGTSPKMLSALKINGFISVGTLKIDYSTLVTLAVTVLVMVGLTLFVKYSKTGRAMVAVSEDRDAALLMGINTNAIIAVTFAIGSALAAVACYLMLTKGSSVTATFGAMPGIKAFTAAVIGGIGSIPGAMLGGILLGVVESVSLSIPALAPYTDAVEFAILIVILLVKPAGLLGKMRREKV